MNQSTPTSESIGYLVVRVSTARGAIPLEGATVNVRGSTAADSGILFSLRTDRDGKTEKIALPTPTRSASTAPGNTAPYATYNLDVFSDGYIPLAFHNVPVFPEVVSIQPAVMVPLPESGGDTSRPLYPASAYDVSEGENPDL